MIEKKVLISVIGSHEMTTEVESLALNVGKIVVEVGCILVCGGLGGAMEAASRGAKQAGGLTIGLLPGKDKSDANKYIDIPINTTIGFARNAMVACSGDIIIALPGSHGTSCEISYGFVYNKPIFDLGNWNKEGMIKVKDLSELKDKLNQLVKEIRSN